MITATLTAIHTETATFAIAFEGSPIGAVTVGWDGAPRVNQADYDARTLTLPWADDALNEALQVLLDKVYEINEGGQTREECLFVITGAIREAVKAATI